MSSTLISPSPQIHTASLQCWGRWLLCVKRQTTEEATQKINEVEVLSCWQWCVHVLCVRQGMGVRVDEVSAL